MADKKKKGGTWLGHAILDQEHEKQLHLNAAIFEYQDGLPRHEAEQKALRMYREEHHARAAGHHLHGMKAAMAVGDSESAERHSDLYRLHIKALGHDPSDVVPPVVKRYQNDDEHRPYKFKQHDADDYLVQPVTSGPPPLSPTQQYQAQQQAAVQQQAMQPAQPAAPAPVQKALKDLKKSLELAQVQELASVLDRLVPQK